MTNKKILYWLPRVLALAFTAFLSVFALDVFESGKNFLEVTVALLIHLIPSFILIIATIIAWKKEWLGGIIFILISILFTLFFNTYQSIITLLLISGPVLLIGILFYFQGIKK